MTIITTIMFAVLGIICVFSLYRAVTTFAKCRYLEEAVEKQYALKGDIEALKHFELLFIKLLWITIIGIGLFLYLAKQYYF